MEEIWKEIPGWEGFYEASNLGNVRSLPRIIMRPNGRPLTVKGRVLKQATNRNGYKAVVLCRHGIMKTIKVHRLIAAAFIQNPLEHSIVNHKNEVKSDNRADNLEWCTYTYNMKYGTAPSRRSRSLSTAMKNNPNHSRPVIMMDLNGKITQEFPSLMEAQRQTGIPNQNIWSCCAGGRQRTAGGYKWKYNQPKHQ